MIEQPEADVAVLGGGLSGLFAALHLARAGKRVVVVEQSREPGGQARDLELDGLHIDPTLPVFTGDGSDEIIADLRAISPDGLREVSWERRLRWQGQDVERPLSYSDFSGSTSVGAKAWEFLGMLGAHVKEKFRKRPHKTAEETLKSLYGSPVYTRFFKQCLETRWGLSPAELAPLLVAECVERLEALDGLRNFLSKLGLESHASLRPAQPSSHSGHAWCEGGSQLAVQLAKAVRDAGGKISLGAQVTDVEMDGDEMVAVTWQDLDSDPELPIHCRMPCRALISTIPVRSLVKAFGTSAPAQVHASSLHLQYRPMATYVCLLKRSEPCLPTAILETPDSPIHRLIELNHDGLGLGKAPDGTRILLAEIPAGMDSPEWHGYEETWNQIFQVLEAESICKRAEISERDVIQSPNHSPILRLEIEEHATRVFRFFSKFPAVECAGRTGSFSFATPTQALSGARQAAEGILQRLA